MQQASRFGYLNGHSVGRVLKEAVRRATVVIRNERLVFEAQIKQGYDGEMNDIFTSADKKAQEVYLRTFQECFPNYGVIGEEDNLRIEPKNGCTLYFTVDPLDGTRAYIRRQSHGVGTMVALCDGGEVLSAYIGDINTEEMYGYRPGSSKAHRITRLDTFETLGYGARSKVRDSYALLRDPASIYSPQVRQFIRRFKNHEVMGSSIGTWAARLWKREVMALLLPPGIETPWDSAPVVGISKKLDYAFLRPRGTASWEPYAPIVSPEMYQRHHETLIIHKSELNWLF